MRHEYQRQSVGAGEVVMDPVGSFANRTLEREAWARQKLAAHAGRTVRIRIGLAWTTLCVGPEGFFNEAHGAPDLTLTISALSLPALLAEPTRWPKIVFAHGDEAFAQTLGQLAQTLPWFVERELAKALGPILGTRVADAGRRLLGFPEYVAARLGDSVASYASDEAQWIV